MGSEVFRLAKAETIAANLGLHWVWHTYPQKLWITLFMKLGDQPASRANTGVQALFKKYRQKNVSIKIKWLYAAEQNAAGQEPGIKWGVRREGRLVH